MIMKLPMESNTLYISSNWGAMAMRVSEVYNPMYVYNQLSLSMEGIRTFLALVCRHLAKI